MTQQITDNLEVSGSLTVDHNLVVTGTITANTFNVENLVTANGSLASVGAWKYSHPIELEGKGFSWATDTQNTQLIYKNGSLFTNASQFDLGPGSVFSVDNIKVLSQDTLGGTVVNSNLQKVGTLRSLEVQGNANIGEFFFINSDSNRVSIGTDEAQAAFSVAENNVVINIGSSDVGRAQVGLYSPHDLEIITDGLPRITVKGNGTVNIGDQAHGGGTLNVYGTLYTKNLVTDYQVERLHPLQFKAKGDQTVYGLGFSWVDDRVTKQFILRNGPDRFWSTESIDVGPGAGYYVNGLLAVGAESLGNTIVNSKLQTVGVLQNLTVSGPSALQNTTAYSALFTLDGKSNTLESHPDGLTSAYTFALNVAELDQFTVNDFGITIGNPLKATAPVKVFGPLSVNVNNPDPTVQFTVSGDVSIGGKKITSGIDAPTSGTFQLGDICYNSAPVPGGFVGWICVAAGTPGVWATFGPISSI